MQIFTKEWVEYPFNPIALVSTALAKESVFCNAIANSHCERNLTLKCNQRGVKWNMVYPKM